MWAPRSVKGACVAVRPSRRTPSPPVGGAHNAEALVAINDWWFMVASSMVSISCACGTGPRTTTGSSFGKIGVPSGGAQRSQQKRKFSRYFKTARKISFARRYSISSIKVQVFKKTTCSSGSYGIPPRRESCGKTDQNKRFILKPML